MSKLRQRIAMIIKAEEGDQGADQAQQLIQQYSDCKNLKGKISPLVIIYKQDMGQLQTMAPKAMADYIIQRVNQLNDQFRGAGVKNEFYDFVTKWLDKMKPLMYAKKNTNEALFYFSNAVLKGDNLGSNVDENTAPPKKKKSASLEVEAEETLFASKAELAYRAALMNHLLKNLK